MNVTRKMNTAYVRFYSIDGIVDVVTPNPFEE